MRALDVGTICIKTAGREAGGKAVIVKVVDDNFVMIEGTDKSGVRKRKCNIAHLIPISAAAHEKHSKAQQKAPKTGKAKGK